MGWRISLCFVLSVMISFFFHVAHCLTVSANISSINQGDDGLPNIVAVSLSVGSNSTKEFYLTRIDHISINVPVYSISRDSNEETVVINENVPNTQNIAFYQDAEREAVLQISALNSTDASGHELIISRGVYAEGDSRYSITPVARVKRDTTKGRHSKQHYEVTSVKSPHTRSYDFILPGPDTVSPPTVRFLKNWTHIPNEANRPKRQTQSTYYIDVTAVLDYNSYRRFMKQAANNSNTALSKIQEYYAFIFSGIDLVYQNFDASNIRLRVKLTKVVLFKSSTDFPLSYVNGNTSRVNTSSVLNAFQAFLKSPSGISLCFPYDHVMLFVDSDLWNSEQDILGLAYTRSLCTTNGLSSSVIEDRGNYDSMLPSAHELGHSLSAQHDGVENTCSPKDRYLMAPSDSDPSSNTKLNHWRFSPCTIVYFVTYITGLLDTQSGRTCLTNSLLVKQDFPDVSNRLLGQEIPADKQCQLTLGIASRDCKLADPCTMLYCLDPALSNQCQGQTILPGTSCGCGKVCRQGECIADSLAPICDIWTNCTSSVCRSSNIRNCAKSCSLTTWPATSLGPASITSKVPATTSVTFPVCVDNDGSCSTVMMTSSNNPCYNYIFRSACCATCAKQATNTPGCEYGDYNHVSCSSITSCKGHSDICCQTCKRSGGHVSQEAVLSVTMATMLLVNIFH